MIPALSRAGLLEHHQELQVKQDHQEKICSILQLTHLLIPSELAFLFCSLYE